MAATSTDTLQQQNKQLRRLQNKRRRHQKRQAEKERLAYFAKNNTKDLKVARHQLKEQFGKEKVFKNNPKLEALFLRDMGALSDDDQPAPQPVQILPVPKPVSFRIKKKRGKIDVSNTIVKNPKILGLSYPADAVQQ